MKKKKVGFLSLLVLIMFTPVLYFNFYSINFHFLKKSNDLFHLMALSWTENGNPICINSASQSSNIMISNENGSIFIIWKDQRNELNAGDIYGQIINLKGDIQWESNGKQLINAIGLQNPKGLIYSNLNCAIYVWEDNRTGNFDIYVQKINLTSGNNLWANNGTIICNANNNQIEPIIVDDNNGGAIISWIDERDGGSTLFAQRINSTGSTQWNGNGTLICNNTNSVINSPQISSDGLNGSIIAWYDNRTGSNNIFCQRIDYSGSIQWIANGISILNLENLTVSNLAMCSDNLNGSIISWTDNRTANILKIFGQRINSTGSIQWLANGTPICNKTSSKQDELQIIEDGEQGSIMVWRDYRNGLTDSNIFTQKINSSGNYKWDENGTAVCTALGHQSMPKLCSDGEKGAIFTWFDLREGFDRRIYAQKINQTGEINWTENGVLICVQENLLESIIISFDKNNGSYISWIDYRNLENNGDIYIQRILNDGELLYSPNPQFILIFPESPTSIFEQLWFYMLIVLIVVDFLLVYYIIKKMEEGEKIIERKA
ncbi:MAG: hypothetical protein ACTSRG_15375 [Candidatus Helarchaeota archaeon]